MPGRTQDWELIENLFSAAVDLRADEQAHFLDRECAGDPDLRREVETLLAADARKGDAIVTALTGEAESFLGVQDLAGSRLGPYRIIRELGRGGMGSVYLAARDDDQYRKEVAIKLIRHGMDTADVLQRFRHERQILANLDHPYIARLLDAGTAPDGRPYFAMEYVSGQTLEDWCAAHPPAGGSAALSTRLTLFLQICEAVSYAHRKLVVHRDLKPANIFVTPEGTPKLVDFGVAKLLEPDVTFRTAATVVAGRPLTPDYASPEQLRGGQITTSTDVYSLGAILYELLSGARAHQFQSQTPREVERVICEADPPQLSGMASDTALRRALQGDLDAIVSMAMRKEQDRRYQSVEQLAGDIRAYLEGRTVFARQGNFRYRAGKYLRRHRTAIALSFLVATALVGGAVTATVQAIRANREQAIAEEARRQAVTSQLRAEASQRNAEVQASEAERQRHEAETERHEADLQKAFAETQRQLADSRFDEVRQLAGKFVIDFNNAIATLPGSTPARKMVVETGLRYYNLLLREAAGNKQLLEEVARGYDSLGDVQGNPYFPNLGDVAGSAASYRQAIAIRDGLSDPSPGFQAERIRSLVRLSQVLVAQGDMKAADEINRRAITLGEQLLQQQKDEAAAYPIREALANAYSSYGDLKIRIGVFNDAVAPYLKLLDLARQSAAAGLHPDQEQSGLSLAETKLGDIFFRLSRQKEAIDHLHQALPIDRRLLAASPSSTSRMRKLYVTYSFLGRALHTNEGVRFAAPGEITEYLTGARDIAVQLSSADPNNRTALVDLAMAETGLGDWLRDQGDYKGAIEAFSRSIPTAESASRLQPAGSEDLMIQVHHRMATGLSAAGRFDEALDHVITAERFLAQAEKQNPGMARNASRRAELQRVRAEVFMGRKDWSAAIDVWSSLIAAVEKQVATDPRLLGDEPVLFDGLAKSYEGAGQTAKAAEALESELDRLRMLSARRTLSDDEIETRNSALSRLKALRDR